MGMYSYHRDEDVVIKDVEGLKEYFKAIEEGKIYDEHPNIKEYVKALKIEYNDYRKEHMLGFAGWDGWKIISYWYEEMVMLLRDLAVYCEGNVEFDFENDDEAGKWEFNDGECLITTGQMNWQDWTPEEHISKKNEMPQMVKERLAVKKL